MVGPPGKKRARPFFLEYIKKGVEPVSSGGADGSSCTTRPRI